MKTQNSLELARYFHAQGLSTIPCHAQSKDPATGWKRFQYRPPETRELTQLFSEPNYNVGIVAGEASDRLLVVDIDSHHNVDRILKELHHPETWIVQTARGAHVYLRTPSTAKSASMDGIDLQAQGKYVLAPKSLHPTGVRYAWLHHPKRIAEIDSMELWPGLVLKPAEMRPDYVPMRAWQLLTGKASTWGHKAGQKPDYSTSAREWAALCSLANAGFDFERVLGLFEKHATAQGHFKHKIAPRGAQIAREWLAEDYKRAVEFVQTHQRPEQKTAHALRSWAMGRIWTGRTGAYDRAVYLAHVQIATQCGQLTFSGGARTLAELSGISKNTVCKANKRLVKAKLIRKVKNATVSLPVVWQLLLPLEEGLNLYTIPTPYVSKCTSFTHHDIFSWGALSKTGALIWEFLQDERLHSTGEIVRGTGRTAKTVRKLLEKMRQLGMVTFEIVHNRAGHAWGAVRGVNLDKVAEQLGVRGRADRKRDQHKRERSIHRRALLQGRA